MFVVKLLYEIKHRTFIETPCIHTNDVKIGNKNTFLGFGWDSTYLHAHTHMRDEAVIEQL